MKKHEHSGSTPGKMKLFEVTNGYIGESYIRVYVWAKNKSSALTLARESFRKHAKTMRKTYWERLECEELFSASHTPFATQPSDGGWRAPEKG